MGQNICFTSRYFRDLILRDLLYGIKIKYSVKYSIPVHNLEFMLKARQCLYYINSMIIERRAVLIYNIPLKCPLNV